VELLRAQNIAVDSLTDEARLLVQEFAVDTLTAGPLFEGHRTIQAEGHWSSRSADTLANPGWYLVRTRQPLGAFAAYLLEPASEDGVVTWNLLDRELQPHTPYPILRTFSAPGLPAVAVP
jgi:dipeptidyl-peptidase-4